MEAGRPLLLPALEHLGRVCARAVGRRGRAVLAAADGAAVDLERELLGAVALPGVAALVGSVGHEVAVEVHEQAVPGLGVAEVLGDATVGLHDARAHAHARTLGQAAGDVGLSRGASVLVEEEVVGVAGVGVAGVALDGACTGELDVAHAADEDTAAPVAAVALDIAGVAGDGAAVDLVVVVGIADTAALVLAGIALNGAAAHDGRLLVELDTAAVALGVVPQDPNVLDQALVRAGRFVDMDAATALVRRFLRRTREGGSIVLDVGLAVVRREGELRLVEVDAATAVGAVPSDLGLVLHRDVDPGPTGVDTAAFRDL